MSELQLIIPTHGRVNEQLTVRSLTGCDLIKRTTLVCPEKEYETLRKMRSDYDVIVQPDSNWRIAQKREWIIQEWVRRGHDKIMMLDDDLRFATRKSKESWELRPIKGDELATVFKQMEDKLGPEFPHVGFGQRQGNNNITEVGWKSPGKMVCTLGYFLPIVSKECRWDLIELREDMCITLQLLLKGYPNAILTESTADQNQFDAPGGCSRFRDTDMNNEEAEKLQALFPNFISIARRVYNQNKKQKALQAGKKIVAKKSETRLEVVIQWRKALEFGFKEREKMEETNARD